MPYFDRQIPFLVLWSQKAGCTSILKWFFWHVGVLEEAMNYGKGRLGIALHQYEHAVFRSRPGHRKELVEKVRKGDPIVSFVRCPYSRLFSSYLHLQNRDFVRLEKNGVDNPGLNYRKSILRDIYGDTVSVEYPMSFHDYLVWLDAQDNARVDPHHAVQWTALFDLPQVVHYRLDDFRAVTANLEKLYGLSDSGLQQEEFASNRHHVDKHVMKDSVTLNLLKTGIPLRRSTDFPIPQVDRELLKNSEYDELIIRKFGRDIALYDSIPAFS